MHKKGMLQKPMLNIQFVKKMETLFDMDKLESVLAGDIDSSFDECNRSEGASKLVYLFISQHKSFAFGACKLTQYIKAQYHASTRNGNFLSRRLKK